MKAHAQELGRRIKECRRSLGITQEELAERAGVNIKTIQGVEQGRTEPELRTIRRLAKTIRTSVDWLVHGPANTARQTEATRRRIEADLRLLSLSTLEHLAPIVRALAASQRQG
ncbi:MAG: helix-turn-helix transcriptional regulator [Deltaproteobacteria bacterium]|nr:helix-turn-helix transcriptional regulator [Deltaproteobacteria bacterium]